MQASTGEIKIHDLLEELDLSFGEEVEFDDLVTSNGKHLRIDFVVYDDAGEILAAIEFNGRQHYVPVTKFGGKKGLYRQQYNDNLKKQWCLKNHIKLISIPYTEESKLNPEYLMYLIDR